MGKDEIYVRHILDSIREITGFLAGKKYEDFLQDKLLQNGILRGLEIVGEAAKKLSEAFRAKHPMIPWKQVVGMRDKLIHDYFDVDLEVVWKTATEDILQLRDELGDGQ